MIAFPPQGSYFVVKTRGFVPLMIRLLTHSRFDHAGVVINDAGDIIEAEPGGARIGNLGEYAGLPILVNTRERMFSEQRAIVADVARRCIGTPYGFLDIVRLGLRCAGIHWGRLTRRADSEHAMICSEIVAACGQAAGLDWLCGREAPAAVTPGDLARRPGMQPWTPTVS